MAGGHGHGGALDTGNVVRVRAVFWLTASYAVVQAVGGWFSGSLALIADSGQMVSDATLPGVASAGHFHAWVLTDNSTVATVHVTPAPGADPLALPDLVASRLHERFDIDHVTVQLDAPGRRISGHGAASS